MRTPDMPEHVRQLCLAIFVTTQLAACAAWRPQVSPKIAEAKRFAVATYYGPATVFGGSGVIGIVNGFINAYGVSVADATIDEVYARIKETLAADVLPLSAAPESESYDKATVVKRSWASAYAAPRGMRPLSIEPKDD